LRQREDIQKSGRRKAQNREKDHTSFLQEAFQRKVTEVVNIIKKVDYPGLEKFHLCTCTIVPASSMFSQDMDY